VFNFNYNSYLYAQYDEWSALSLIQTILVACILFEPQTTGLATSARGLELTDFASQLRSLKLSQAGLVFTCGDNNRVLSSSSSVRHRCRCISVLPILNTHLIKINKWAIQIIVASCGFWLKESEERLGRMDGWSLKSERFCCGLCNVSWRCHYLWLQATVP
jgi:hypothetical protein